MLTADRLRALLCYDPPTGIFTRRISTSSNARAGDIAGYVKKDGYLWITIGGHVYAAHRLAWLYMTGAWPCNEVDHRNLDKSDSRWLNLREATRTQNEQNKGLLASNKSGLKGACWNCKHRQWRAQIHIAKKQIFLGHFNTPEAAHAAYREAAVRYFGKYARTV